MHHFGPRGRSTPRSMDTPAKLVVITGCTRGLGRAMVTEFAAGGWTVAGCSRNSDAISKLRGAYPAPHFFQVANVADEEDVMNFCAELLERRGAPDLLLNNAA